MLTFPFAKESAGRRAMRTVLPWNQWSEELAPVDNGSEAPYFIFWFTGFRGSVTIGNIVVRGTREYIPPQSL